MNDINNIDKGGMVTDTNRYVGTIFAHYHCARQAGELGRYTYFANKETMGKHTTGVCEFCGLTWQTVYHVPVPSPLEQHFI
jgi:hypothetical protein